MHEIIGFFHFVKHFHSCFFVLVAFSLFSLPLLSFFFFCETKEGWGKNLENQTLYAFRHPLIVSGEDIYELPYFFLHQNPNFHQKIKKALTKTLKMSQFLTFYSIIC